MTKKIQLIVGSTRENRVGAQVAEWVATHARAYDGIELEVIDLKEVNLPFFTGPIPPSYAPDSTEAGQAWAKRIAEGDGYIFVTAEYNRGVPARPTRVACRTGWSATRGHRGSAGGSGPLHGTPSRGERAR